MTLILGKSQATAQQMAAYLLSKNPKPKFSRNITALEFCQIFLDECAKEGVRGDGAFAQSCKETGYFAYGGDVKYTQNNFAGIGATGGVPGCSFSSIEVGVLAQAQHLKTYATKEPLNCANVDPRRTTWFVNTKGGTAKTFEELGGSWACPGYNTKKYKSLEEANKAKDSYGYQIIDILNDILKIKTKEETRKYYRVQCGAFSVKANAETLEYKLKQAGFNTYIKKVNGLYKVQLGAFGNKANAETLLETVESKGFDAFLTYC